MAGIIYTELLKLRKSIIPWMILLGGTLPAVIALLTVSSESGAPNRDMLFINSLNYMNLISLLLVAVLTGYIFAGEYYGKTINILFSYPIPRLAFFINKTIVTLCSVVFIYITLNVSTIVVGYIYMESIPTADFLYKLLGFSILAVLINFSLVPLTILVSIVAKGAAASTAAGLAYVLTYFCFSNSGYAVYIPVCAPNAILVEYFISGQIDINDLRNMLVTALITFTLALISSMGYYSRSDVQ